MILEKAVNHGEHSEQRESSLKRDGENQLLVCKFPETEPVGIALAVSMNASVMEQPARLI